VVTQSFQNTRIFVAGAEVDVVDSTGNECSISEGDALRLTVLPPPDKTAADVVVLSSKGGQECHSGATVQVAIVDLQEMQNHMRAMIDQGLGQLQSNQGTGGLPVIPAIANAPPVQAAFATNAPAPDPNGAAELQQQLAQADQAETQALNESQQVPGGPSAVASAPPVIGIGQTIDEIVAIEGPPKTKLGGGAKQIYIFADGVKVTFVGGKSTNVE
jgi:hypothetical protein